MICIYIYIRQLFDLEIVTYFRNSVTIKQLLSTTLMLNWNPSFLSLWFCECKVMICTLWNRCHVLMNGTKASPCCRPGKTVNMVFFKYTFIDFIVLKDKSIEINLLIFCHLKILQTPWYATGLIPTFGIRARAALSCVGGRNAGVYGCNSRVLCRPLCIV